MKKIFRVKKNTQPSKIENILHNLCTCYKLKTEFIHNVFSFDLYHTIV